MSTPLALGRPPCSQLEGRKGGGGLLHQQSWKQLQRHLLFLALWSDIVLNKTMVHAAASKSKWGLMQARVLLGPP